MLSTTEAVILIPCNGPHFWTTWSFQSRTFRLDSSFQNFGVIKGLKHLECCEYVGFFSPPAIKTFVTYQTYPDILIFFILVKRLAWNFCFLVLIKQNIPSHWFCFKTSQYKQQTTTTRQQPPQPTHLHCTKKPVKNLNKYWKSNSPIATPDI